MIEVINRGYTITLRKHAKAFHTKTFHTDEYVSDALYYDKIYNLLQQLTYNNAPIFVEPLHSAFERKYTWYIPSLIDEELNSQLQQVFAAIEQFKNESPKFISTRTIHLHW